MNTLIETANKILEQDNYVVTSHAIPDGDCIGSLVAFYLGLNQIGKKVQMVLQDPVPNKYKYLSGVNDIKTCEQLEGSYDNVIFLDCSDEGRVGDKVINRLQGRSFTINIDHHVSNEAFGDLNFVDASAAATAEIIYKLLCTMRVTISADIANALFAGIVMDTGSFMNANTTSSSFSIASELLEFGADVEQARINLFESKPKEEILLIRQALNNIGFSDDGKIAWMCLHYDEVKSINALDLHPEGIINFTRMIQGVEVGILFREVEPGIIKIGFRSKGNINVAQLAGQLGGGGHSQAAGARQEGALEEVREKVFSVVKGVVN